MGTLDYRIWVEGYLEGWRGGRVQERRQVAAGKHRGALLLPGGRGGFVSPGPTYLEDGCLGAVHRVDALDYLLNQGFHVPVGCRQRQQQTGRSAAGGGRSGRRRRRPGILRPPAVHGAPRAIVCGDGKDGGPPAAKGARRLAGSLVIIAQAGEEEDPALTAVVDDRDLNHGAVLGSCWSGLGSDGRRGSSCRSGRRLGGSSSSSRLGTEAVTGALSHRQSTRRNAGEVAAVPFYTGRAHVNCGGDEPPAVRSHQPFRFNQPISSSCDMGCVSHSTRHQGLSGPLPAAACRRQCMGLGSVQQGRA